MTRQGITMINKRQLRTSVLILAILVVLGFVGMGMYRENESAYELVWSPISSVTEREDMFSLTVNVLDGNHLDELMRFSQLCADSKIPVCFFLSEKFYSVNSENAKKIEEYDTVKKQQEEQLLGVIISSVSDLFLFIYTFYFC